MASAWLQTPVTLKFVSSFAVLLTFVDEEALDVRVPVETLVQARRLSLVTNVESCSLDVFVA